MGFWELLLILFVVLLFFGAGKLAGVGAGLGKAARGFRDALGGDREKPGPGGQPPRE
jgi:sec-independent protein translocase protein TatA